VDPTIEKAKARAGDKVAQGAGFVIAREPVAARGVPDARDVLGRRGMVDCCA